MSLSFYTQNHQMTFVDVSTRKKANAWSLSPNGHYRVFLVIQNDDPLNEERHVAVKVTRNPFGIGQFNPTGNLVQPSPVDVVPPAGPGGNGLMTVIFQYTAPSGGHVCLCATLPNGVKLQQNTDVYSAPINAPSTFSFFVFNDKSTPETMALTLSENPPHGQDPSWQPKLVDPNAGLIAPAPVNINLVDKSAYPVYLQVTVPSNASVEHVFHIEGWVNGGYEGEVDIRVNPDPSKTTIPPAPFVYGGYQSPDIILYDKVTGLPVPIGGQPGGLWDTLLKPDTDYDFAAVIHNDSPTPATDTIVRFWEFRGGVGSAGLLVDIQFVTVPGNGSIEVKADKPFRSLHAGEHKCAAVSISLPGICQDAITASEVPDPASNPNHSCSAWRNTNSKWVTVGKPWKEIFAIDRSPIPGPGPVEIEVRTHYVPTDWRKNHRVQEVADLLAQGATPCTKPLYLMPALQEILKPVDMKVKIEAQTGIKLEHLDKVSVPGLVISKPVAPLSKVVRIFPGKETSTTFTVSGIVPEERKHGDILLVYITAHYPKTDKIAARSVEFLEVLHVKPLVSKVE